MIYILKEIFRSSVLITKAYLYLFNKKRSTRGCDYLVGGHPRVGNTFAGRIFRASNPELMPAHHFHAASQVIDAVNNKVPVLLIIRHPVAVVLSQKIAMNDIKISTHILRYIIYHLRLLPIRNRVAILDFMQLIKQPSLVVDAVNEKYDTHFICPDNGIDKEVLSSIYNDNGREANQFLGLSAPSDAKDALKKKYRNSVANHWMIRIAERIYKKFYEQIEK